jgi:hypothetical protein
MSRAADPWYVRLPDGRVMRAGSTAAVRHHLEAGRIPTDSRVRRPSDDEWQTLDWTAEFSDLAAQRLRTPRANSGREMAGDPAAAGLASLHLHSIGVRGLAEELLAAMDSALVRVKLAIAALTGLLLALAVIAADLLDGIEWPWLVWLGMGLVGLVLVASCATILTQMTFVEVSRLRPARRAEATAGLLRGIVRLACAQFLVGGITVAGLVFLRLVPSWAVDAAALEHLAEAQWLAGLMTAAALILQVLLWPVLGFTLLLAPVIVIEEASVLASLRIWWQLLRTHLSRVFLYEALAFALAGIATLPFLLPIALTLSSAPLEGMVGQIARAVLIVLTGLALTPLLAYLFVANVFIFLNLRYEHSALK